MNHQTNLWPEINPRGDEKISEFLHNLHSALRNPEFASVLSWTDSGDAFIIKDVHKMRSDVLPLYYNHKDLDSFMKDLVALGFQQMNLQNSQILCFHPKFRGESSASNPLQIRKEETRRSEDKEILSNERSMHEDKVRDTSTTEMRTQIGNNELYWEMKLRMSEIEDSNSKLNKRVDELANQVESLQSELRNERQRSEQILNQKGEQGFQSNAMNDHRTIQESREDFERTLENLEKSLNLTGNIQLLQENLAMSSAANDKRAILANIERLKDFLKLKRSLENLHQKKKKKAEKAKNSQEKDDQLGYSNIGIQLMDQIRKMPKIEGINTTVLNQVARTLPQLASNYWLQQNQGSVSSTSIDETLRNDYQQQHAPPQFPVSSNSDTSSNYYLGFPGGFSGTRMTLPPQQLFEAVTTNPRSILLQHHEKEINSKENHEKSYDISHQHPNQTMHQFLTNKQEIAINFSCSANKDQIQTPGGPREFYSTRESNESEEQHKNNHSNQHFGMGLTYTVTESHPTKYSTSLDFQNLIRESNMGDENYQPSGSHPSFNKGNSFLEPMHRAPHVQNTPLDNGDLANHFLHSELSRNNAIDHINSQRERQVREMNSMSKANESHSDHVRMGDECSHLLQENERQTPMSQYAKNYESIEGNHNGDYHEQNQMNNQNYHL